MVLYFGILVYTYIAASIGCVLKKSKKHAVIYSYADEQIYLKNQKTISLFFACISFSLLVFFVGMRTRYADTSAYILRFNNISPDLSLIRTYIAEKTEDIGFQILMVLFKRFVSQSANDWLMFLAIFQAGAVVLLYYKYSDNFAMSAYLFIASTTFTWMMNGIRQFTAACLILYFFDFVVKRKTLKFILVVIAASTIHFSAIVWILVYFIVRLRPWSKEIWICVLLTIAFAMGIDEFMAMLDNSLAGTSYEGTGDLLLNYADDDGVNFIRVIIAAVAPLLALMFRKNIKNKTPDVIKIFINMSVVGVGIYLIGTVTSGIMVGRMPIYFTVTNYILLPWVLENAIKGKLKIFMKFMCYIMYFLYFYYVMEIQGFGNYTSSILNLYYS